jgi:hypothetical protein
VIAKLRVGGPPQEIYGAEEIELTIPVVLPEMDEIRQLAFTLHARGKAYETEMWGWPVSYDPGSPERPIDSKLTFTPALFFIGVWPIWYVSFSWEYDNDAEPHVLIGDENIVLDAAHGALEDRPIVQRLGSVEIARAQQ